jgi:hypothetical protein
LQIWQLICLSLPIRVANLPASENWPLRMARCGQHLETPLQSNVSSHVMLKNDECNSPKLGSQASFILGYESATSWRMIHPTDGQAA